MIYLGLETIANAGKIPIGIKNTICACSAGRTANAEVILRATMNLIKWIPIISSYFIKLCYRQVGFKIPVFSCIKTFIHTTIATHQVMVSIIWVDPDNVVINMLTFFAKICKSFTCIFTHSHVSIYNKNLIHIFRIAKYFLVIITAC